MSRPTAEIIRFDDHHPSFGNTGSPNDAGRPPKRAVHMTIDGAYAGAVLMGDVLSAWSADWRWLGQYASLDGALAAIGAELEP